MQRLRRRRAHARLQLAFVSVCASVLSGCASPGPPHPPSLHLPRLVSDLSATRSGAVVELRFTVPQRTTDGQPVREATLRAVLCRQLGNGRCEAVDSAETSAPLPVPKGDTRPVQWTDTLPAALLTGEPRVLAYRVELLNAAGKTAGYSDPAYVPAGAPPPPVAGLAAEGTRLGVKLQWSPVRGAGEVLLERTEPGAAPAASQRPSPTTHTRGERPGRTLAPELSHKKAETPGTLWLQAAPGDQSAAATLDGSDKEGTPYTYIAIRREIVKIGNRTLELRSAPSAPVTITWRDIYPSAAPQGLTALGFDVPAENSSGTANAPQAAPAYAVDLVWQPVNDARLAGYLMYRQTLNAAGEPAGPRIRLTPQPITAPGFHDPTAQPGTRYRYTVTAIDPKGNESAAAETVVEPEAAP